MHHRGNLIEDFDFEKKEKSCHTMLRRREQFLTVDCIAYNSIQESGNNNLFVVEYNINIPASVVQNPEERIHALERVKTLLETDFEAGDIIDYQITGTYELRNTDTGLLREWVGNFYAHMNNPAMIQEFQLFDGRSFVNDVYPMLDNVEAQLLFNGRDSKWKFERLQSIIFNVQCTVYQNHKVLQNRKLTRKKRKFRNTFDLP